jgi:exodeoxyribonuclease V alpha subunit
LVIDADDRLYLRRHFDYEQRLARRLTQASRPFPRELDAIVASRLTSLFADQGRGQSEVDWQKVAAALALQRGLTIISGGPGTGKTTTVVNLLACLLYAQPDCRIALAAPTGKAAARMIEAIRSRARNLPEELRELLPKEAFTVHRLLRSRPDRGFEHDSANPLAIDALVVDEASMLDLALATRLFDAVPPTARIILLGDKDQLEAVESGAVFAELSANPVLTDVTRLSLAALCGIPPAALATSPPAADAVLQDAVVWFTRSHRFADGSGIGRLASSLLVATANETIDWLRHSADRSVRWSEGAGRGTVATTLAAATTGYALYGKLIATGNRDPAAATRAFDEFRVLCAMREGPRGTLALNEQIARWIRQALPAGDEGQGSWFAGRPVMVARNDYALRLFNGDVGIALSDHNGALRVWFPDQQGQFRSLAPAQLPEHETAFAMTVHKSQGSEFGSVLVVLPDRPNRIVGRELLYTAVTRARENVSLHASEAVLRAAIESPSRRRSGLRARLREAAAQT